jgi:hypothetical protein
VINFTLTHSKVLKFSALRIIFRTIQTTQVHDLRTSSGGRFVILQGVTNMQGLTLQQNTKRTAPPELLQQIKATIPKKASEPSTLSEILRRAKGGYMRHRYRGRYELDS